MIGNHISTISENLVKIDPADPEIIAFQDDYQQEN